MEKRASYQILFSKIYKCIRFTAFSTHHGSKTPTAFILFHSTGEYYQNDEDFIHLMSSTHFNHSAWFVN